MVLFSTPFKRLMIFSLAFIILLNTMASVRADNTIDDNAENIDLLSLYSIDKQSTGSKKVFLVPQISYSQDGITVFATSEIPLYQYLNGIQVGSQYQFTVGVNYRFLTKKSKDSPSPIN